MDAEFSQSQFGTYLISTKNAWIRKTSYLRKVNLCYGLYENMKNKNKIFYLMTCVYIKIECRLQKQIVESKINEQIKNTSIKIYSRNIHAR